MRKLLHNWKYWTGPALVAIGLTTALVLYLTQNAPGPERANASDTAHHEEEAPTVATVDVVRPQKGLDYEVEQPGSVRPYESVQLQAKVSGFLQVQNVDIGDRVKKGDVLAIIAVPELDKQLQRNRASVEQASARVSQMEARVVSAEADHKAAEAGIVQADAGHKSAEAWVRFRLQVYERYKLLFASNSIEEKLVEEKKEQYEASLETERAARAAIATSTANLAAAAAKIKQAQADVKGAESEVKVAQADVDKTQVLLDYAVIKAPFDGAIRRRNFFPGDFIRSAGEGVTQPLLTVQRTDKLRVIVQVPDSAVPYLHNGDRALVRIDSLPGKKFPARVSRKTGEEDPNTRLMHVEVDVPNPTGEIGTGMYGQVRILLDRFPNLLSIPTSCVVHGNDGRASVYVVKDGRLALRDVRLGKDIGQRVAVVSGLQPADQVVRQASAGLTAGLEVQTRLIDDSPTLDEEP